MVSISGIEVDQYSVDILRPVYTEKTTHDATNMPKTGRLGVSLDSPHG